MKIKYNNKTLDYDLINNGNTIFSSTDNAFGGEECGYRFLKDYLHIDDEKIKHGYDRFFVSLDNFDNIISADLFNEEGELTRHIDKETIDAILLGENKKISSIVFDGKNSNEVISFLSDNKKQAYQEEDGRLRAFVDGKMETIFKDDKISINNNEIAIDKPDYVTENKLRIQDINSIDLIQPDKEVIKSMESSIANLEKELTYYPNDRAIMEQLANTLDEFENEKNSQSFLITYSSEHSETPSYDTFSKEEIQELFKDMPIEEFKYNIVPYLEGEELEKMTDVVYPSRNENITIQGELETSTVNSENIVVDTDKIKEYLLSEYHKAGIENLQIDAVMGAIKDSIQQGVEENRYNQEIKVSKNIGISVGLNNGKVHLGIDREELLASKTFDGVYGVNSPERTTAVKIKKLDTLMLGKGSGDIADKINADNFIIKDIVQEFNKEADLLIVGIEQNNTKYYLAGTVNGDITPQSFSFRVGKDSERLVDINNQELPYFTNASRLLLDTFKEALLMRHCDKLLADDVLRENIEKANNTIDIYTNHGLLEERVVRAENDDILTVEALTQNESGKNTIKDEITFGDIKKDIQDKENSSVVKDMNSNRPQSNFRYKTLAGEQMFNDRVGFDEVVKNKAYFEQEKDGLKAVVVTMPPQDYIKAVEERQPDHKNYGADEDKLDNLKEVYEAGIKVDVPMLAYGGRDSDSDLFQQEGYHRAVSAQMINKELIPVAIRYREGDENIPDFIKKHIEDDKTDIFKNDTQEIEANNDIAQQINM